MFKTFTIAVFAASLSTLATLPTLALADRIPDPHAQATPGAWQDHRHYTSHGVDVMLQSRYHYVHDVPVAREFRARSNSGRRHCMFVHVSHAMNADVHVNEGACFALPANGHWVGYGGFEPVDRLIDTHGQVSNGEWSATFHYRFSARGC
ncbi:hypothetical protein [Pararhodobacter oceanensis]|nr:hypothetical protein [Pararhodobacter oceanensis]